MTRESNYRIHEELKATKQRPWQPPSAPPRRFSLKLSTLLWILFLWPFVLLLITYLMGEL